MSTLTDAIRKRFLISLNEVRDENRDMRSNINLAKKIRTQPTRISEWENGKGNPTVEHIYWLCKEFDKSPAFIITGKKENNQEHVRDTLEDAIERISNLEKQFKSRRKTG